MDFEKGQICTNCGEPDEFSDETMCRVCIDKWKEVLRIKERNRFIEHLDTLKSLCFTREAKLSDKIIGHDYNNGYSCALHDIRNELEGIKKRLKRTQKGSKRWK